MGNPRYANGHRRRELRKRILASETVCALCGLPVDKTLHYLDPWAAEVDEIIPVSRGGDPLSRKNCRLAHRVCNKTRGNRMDTDMAPVEALKTSRAW